MTSYPVDGTIPALLTPFSEGGAEVDFELLDEHVAWLAERGVRTISPLGTTGEGPSLSLAERKHVIERLAAHPAGMKLLPGPGCTALPETVELSRFAVEHGAAGVLVAPPWYYDATPAGTARYFGALIEALPADARVFLYHIPVQTGVPIEDETMRALRDRYGPPVAGAKDSSGDLEHATRWIRDFPLTGIIPRLDARIHFLVIHPIGLEEHGRAFVEAVCEEVSRPNVSLGMHPNRIPGRVFIRRQRRRLAQRLRH